MNDALDPAKSVWVSANAGSGKTYTLANRVARLLLNEVKPERILCLTYTKAAAAEMQSRLFDQLGIDIRVHAKAFVRPRLPR